ncbi:hypothetical protein FPZ43_15715 [Mucilaginibacter pallidiroseus]|uniref:Uncharacterized protein n=1 Tax=Mucilaginibacter pallidiroseus TaxID=2599295 RepID=A0A563U335_9SPHI|nr:hypothetical protein [Mucilaginibacter pallidiroseus]TWR25732.1 hypothetical protein FPZ43_15715 [Mucilaginibacter pallidiroseus]
MTGKKLLLYVCIILIIGAAIIGFLNIGYFKAYYKDLQTNDFTPGSRLYAFEAFNYSKNFDLPIYRIAESQTSSEKKIVLSGKCFLSDSLIKHKSAYIGNYLNRKLISIKYKASNGTDTTSVVRLYAIMPNPKAVNTTRLKAGNLPQSYKFIDSNLYITDYSINPKQSK